MSQASDFIEAAEARAGCRWDDPSGVGFAALMGAMAREMGANRHGPRDDVAAGMLLLFHISPAGRQRERADDALRTLLLMGLGPDDLAELVNGGKEDR